VERGPGTTLIVVPQSVKLKLMHSRLFVALLEAEFELPVFGW